MKTNYLLPNKYKTLGWILFIIGIISGIFLYAFEYETDLLTTKVLSIYNNDILTKNSNGFFKILENSILDEIIAISIIVGGLIIVFSKEKIEDEFIYKLRTESLIWAVIFNYVVLVFAILFIYGLTFFDVIVFNMFTPIIFFVFRFNFLKAKSK